MVVSERFNFLHGVQLPPEEVEAAGPLKGQASYCKATLPHAVLIKSAQIRGEGKLDATFDE